MVANDENPKDYGNVFDTISVCLSKGLGAPMGSVLVGKQQFMDKAIRVRKILGGGMRQVGYMAAAGIYALDHHMDRMRVDHQRAKALGAQLEVLDAVTSVEAIDTNIVIFKLSEGPSKQKFMNELSHEQIAISDMGQGKLRIVTHLDYTESDHDRFLSFLNDFS
jgi:threonine aldolase